MDIKDTYRTIKDTNPAHDDLVFIWCSKHPYRYLHIHHFMRTFHHGFL